MVEGIVWSFLLLVFLGLGWLGWQEYQKVEAYRRWAQQFERSKYDIYAVLGQVGQTLTWGRPTRKGPVDLMSCSLTDIYQVDLCIDSQVVEWQHPPPKAKTVAIELKLRTQDESEHIPFTEIALAADWVSYLRQVVAQ